MTQRVTIKSIARDLGISHMTVSRALSGNPNVNADTRKAVQKRAREMGYVKSAAAQAMRGDGTRIVGLLLPNIVNEFYARFANTMAQCCEENALHLLIHLTGDDIEQERHAIARLQEVQAMAVVLVPAPGDDPPVTSDMNDMRVVQLIRKRSGLTGADEVLIDDGEAIEAAVQYVAKLGHQRIGFIGAETTLSSGTARLQAFLHGLETSGLPETPELVRTGVPSFEMGRTCAAELLKTAKATAILCGGVEISNGALSLLMERSLLPGRDLGFVGYGDPSYYAWIGGGVPTIQLPVEELARSAVALLAEDPSPTHPHLKARLHLR